jgi:cytochrome P450
MDFCSTEGNRPHIPPDPSMLHQDGAQHTKQRGLVAKGFTPRAMRESEEYCEKIVAELIDAFADSGEADIAFGFGSHFCLGANLARLELRTALRALLRRFETVALKPGGRHEWASSSFTRGPMHMDLVFG